MSGNAPTVVGVGTDGHNLLSANGTTLFLNSSFVLYTNTAIRKATSDSFQYTVQDAGGNTTMSTVAITITYAGQGTGASQGTVGQSISLAPESGRVTLNFFGVPGYPYTVERSTDLVNWVPISAVLTAPPTGLMRVTVGSAIPEGNPVGVTFSQTLSGQPSGPITSLAVDLNISGGYDGGLFASLT